MKIFFSFFLLFSFTFGIKDYLIKPKIFSSKVLYSKIAHYPESLSSKIDSDDYNFFKYKGHFRVIYGKKYENNVTIKNLVDNILKISNFVWNKEVEEFGFREPKNSSKYYIDIYLGNTKAFNKAENQYVTINDYYAGYATSYVDSTPYFIINPKMSLNLIKVTIAHEFFHTIQFAYGLDKVSDYIWNKNLWFLEASATMMEDEVFDNVNDYINYLKYYLPHINYSLEYTNGIIEYGKMLFVKFLKNKFGIDFIKSIFENYKFNETILEDLKKESIFYNENFDDVMLDYGVCLANIHNCFKDGNNFPDVDMYMIKTSKDVGYYGIVLFSNGSDSYLISSTSYYLQCDFDGNKNVLSNINNSGLVFISKKDKLNTEFLKFNIFKGFILEKGWNLISNIFSEDIDFNKLDVKIIWALRNGKYCGYSKVFSKIIKENNLECKTQTLNPGEGIWVYVDNDKTININKYYLFSNNKIENGIKGLSAVIESKEINATIWYFNNKKWYYYSNKEYNYTKIDKLLPGHGYFIFKDQN